MAEPQATPKSKVIEWIKAIVWTAVAWVLLTTFVVQAYRIPSPSMERTLMVGDVLFVNKFLFGAKLPFVDVRTPAVREPRRDDIVVFLSPIEDSMLVKRLIGIPGDTVEMRQGALYRNGKALVEPWAQSTDPGWSADESTRLAMRQMQLPHFVGADPDAYLPDVHQWGPLVVPDDSLWMMGDNRHNSEDSRVWGFVPEDHVVGKPVIIWFSTSKEGNNIFSRINFKRIFKPVGNLE